MHQKKFKKIFIILIPVVILLLIVGIPYLRFRQDIIWKYKGPFLGDYHITTKYLITENQKIIAALDRNTGQPKWSFTAPNYTKEMTVAINAILQDKVIVSTNLWTNKSIGTAYLYALNLETGNVIWKSPLSVGSLFGNSKTNTIFLQDTIFPVDDVYIYGIDASTGREKWKLPITSLSSNGLNSFLSSIYKDDILYSGIQDHQDNNYYFAIDVASGRIEWIIKLDGFSDRTVIENEKLYMSYYHCKNNSNRDCIGEFDINSGNKLWEIKSSSLGFIINKGILYKEENNVIEAIDLTTKKVLWKYRGNNINRMIMDQGVIYLSEVSGIKNLKAIDMFSGKQLWSIQAGNPIYKSGDAIFAEDWRSTGFDTHVNILQKIDTNSKRKLWEFPGSVSDAKGMGDILYFFASKNGISYLYAVK